jgi:rubrerythrin
MRRFGVFFLIGMLYLTVANPRVVVGQNALKGNAVTATADSASPPKGDTVLKNLQSSYRTETHEHALYLEFGKKADEEGYRQVASMFRAVARAEEIHAANKAELIKEMGSIAKEDSTPMLVRTTKQNLDLAATSETYEQDVEYSAFLAQAKRDKNKAAEQTFVYSQSTEAGHLALFKQALNDLESYRGENVPFLVCSHCGQVVRTLKSATCPICGTARDKFETVR